MKTLESWECNHNDVVIIGVALVGRFIDKFVRRPFVLSAVGLVAIVACLAAFPSGAIAAPIYAYDNLDAAQIWDAGDRINTGYRGRAQGFVANISGSLRTAVFGLDNLNGTTGVLNSALYNVQGTGPYGIGSQVGSTVVFSTSELTGIYTNVDVTSLGWEMVSGNKYAVALWSDGSTWNNPEGSGGGVRWRQGSSNSDNIAVFNNWNVVVDNWEVWENPTTGFSVGLSEQVVPAVPEPSTYAMALTGLACGGYMMFRRRRAA
jgi:hypothetical protein